MIGLHTTRVIIVDDDVKEAIPMLKAFAERGISAAYFDGTTAGLPPVDARLTGVRLAILDMALTPGVADESKISQLLAHLERILSECNGPYFCLIWTKHPELKGAFENRLFNSPTVPKPVLTAMLRKADFRTHGAFNLKRLARRLEQELGKASPFFILQRWEDLCAQSATEVTNELSTLATPPRASDLSEWQGIWKKEALRLMRSIAEAQAGQVLKREGGQSTKRQTCLAALHGLLTPLLADRIESRTSTPSNGKFPASVDEILAASATSTAQERAKLMAMLHVAAGNEPFFAGCVYRVGSKPKLVGMPSKEKLLEDVMQKKTDAEKAQKGSFLVIVECNAACDHAQNKIKIARYMTGVLIPETHGKQIKRADFVWTRGPFSLQRGVTPGDYWLCLSALNMVVLDLKTARGRRSIGRVRSEAFADLQAWLSRHIARPGMVEFR